jgi:arsenate reductase-like glutaredoxin family protein
MEINAKKEKYGREKALELAAAVTDLYAAKGKNVVHINIKKDNPDEESLLKLMLGPTGNLRAPALRVGKRLLIGFERGMYEQIFG